MTEWVEEWICFRFCGKLKHFSKTIWMILEGHSYGQLLTGSFITTMCSLTHHVLCRVFWWNINYPGTQPRFDVLWLLAFPKTKITFGGAEIQTIDEIQENTTGQLMVIGRTVWGPKVPTLKGTEVSLSLYLVSSSLNISIFHITWLDTFWTNLIYPYISSRTSSSYLQILNDIKICDSIIKYTYNYYSILKSLILEN